MAENNRWLTFVRMLGDESDGEEPRESGLYKLIIEHFPIQFMQKLLSTAVDNSTARSDRVHAASVIRELNDDGFVEINYSNIDLQSLETLRRHALSLMVDYEADTTVKNSGQELTLTLLRQSLKSGEEWNEFLQFAEEGFAQISLSANNYAFLEVFSSLNISERHDLMGMMKSGIEERRGEFDEIVVQLLQRAQDEKPFLLLPSIIRTFDQKIPTEITQQAMMSPFLADFNVRDPVEAVHVSEILASCIEHSDFFGYTPSYSEFKTFDLIASHIVESLNTCAVFAQHTEMATLAASNFTETMSTKFTEFYSMPDPYKEQDEEEDMEEASEEEEEAMDEDEDEDEDV